MIKSILLLSALALLSSCMPSSRSIVGPDGTAHELISCNYVEYCYEEAYRICNGPYRIVNTSNEQRRHGDSTTIEVKLLVKCGAEPPKPDWPNP